MDGTGDHYGKQNKTVQKYCTFSHICGILKQVESRRVAIREGGEDKRRQWGHPLYSTLYVL
jgi:hypothetical protein